MTTSQLPPSSFLLLLSLISPPRLAGPSQPPSFSASETAQWCKSREMNYTPEHPPLPVAEAAAETPHPAVVCGQITRTDMHVCSCKTFSSFCRHPLLSDSLFQQRKADSQKFAPSSAGELDLLKLPRTALFISRGHCRPAPLESWPQWACPHFWSCLPE